MTLSSNVNSLATRVATEFKTVRSELANAGASVTISETAPTGNEKTWFNSTNGAFYIKYDNTWVNVSGPAGPAGPGVAGVTATATELNYSAGVTSSIQSQLNGKQAVVGGVNSTKIGYLSNVTSDIQNQFSGKADLLSPTLTMATLASASNTVDPLTISTANGHGGTGYAGLMKLENSGAGVTNPKKFVRMNNAGALEIINDAYSSTIFNLADNGNLSISGTYNGVSLGDTGWSNAGLTNNFVSGGSTPGYRRLNGVVYLRGNVNNGTAGQTAFTLPSGYRPSSDFVVPVQQFGTSNINYVSVYTDGRVVPQTSGAWFTGVVIPLG